MNGKNEIWLTRQSIKHAPRKVKSYKGRKTFAKGFSLNLDNPESELDKVLFPIMKKYL